MSGQEQLPGGPTQAELPQADDEQRQAMEGGQQPLAIESGVQSDEIAEHGDIEADPTLAYIYAHGIRNEHGDLLTGNDAIAYLASRYDEQRNPRKAIEGGHGNEVAVPGAEQDADGEEQVTKRIIFVASEVLQKENEADGNGQPTVGQGTSETPEGDKGVAEGAGKKGGESSLDEDEDYNDAKAELAKLAQGGSLEDLDSLPEEQVRIILIFLLKEYMNKGNAVEAPAERRALPPGNPEGPTAAEMDEATRINEKLGPAQERYQKAFERYTELSARQRNSHLGRLETTGKVRKFFGFLNKLTHPIDTYRSKKWDEEREEARLEFLAATREMSLLAADTKGSKEERDINGKSEREHSRAILFQLDAHDKAEDRILEKQAEAANVRRGRGIGGWAREKMDRFSNRLARNWHNSGRAGKVFKVGVPAALIGGGIGGAALVLSPWIAPALAGAGAGLAGRKFGERYAKSVNKRLAGTLTEVQARLREEADARSKKLWADTDTSYDSDRRKIEGRVNRLDITQPIEAGTKQEYTANASRYTKAGTIGALAASLTYGGIYGGIRGSGLVGGHHGHNAASTSTTKKPPASTSTTKKPPATSVKTPKTSPSGAPANPNVGNNISTTSVPWETAHQAAQDGLIGQGREMDVVRQAAAAFHDHLANIPGNTSGEQWVVNAAGQAQNAAQQHAFDVFLRDGILNGQFK